MSKKRHELDPIFKQIITDILKPLPVTVQTEVEVSRLPRTIDVIVWAESAEAEHQLRTQTLFHHFLSHNQIEFKGLNDSLTLRNYARILGRTHLYLGENDLLFDEMSVTIICSSKPRTVLQSQLRPHIFTDKGEGLYQNEGFPQVSIIVINELPVTAEYTPLLLFASSKNTFVKVMVRLLEKEMTEQSFEYVSYALKVRPDTAKEILEMSGIYEENLQILANEIGDILVPLMKPEDRFIGLTSEEIRTLSQQAIERILWKKIAETNTSNERKNAIQKMSHIERAVIFHTKDKRHLIDGLDKVEQAEFLAWIENKGSEEK